MLKAILALLWAFSTVQAAPKQVINIGNSAEPKDLDPHIIQGMPEFNINLQLFEGLTSYEPKTGKVIPGVAEKWKISPDQLVWTFYLRKNAQWSNGEPVTAQDFVYSWTRTISPAQANEYAFLGYFIKNAEKYNKGELKDASQLGLKAVDAHTFEVTLEKPTPFLLKLAFYSTLFPVHKASVEKHGKNWTRPGNLVGNGAFVLSKWEVNQVITLNKNPKYWDEARVKLQEANYYPVENQITEERMFRSGQLDLTYFVPAEKVAFWLKDKTGVFHSDPILSIYHYKLNVTKPPFDDKRVRKAFALAIDRTSLVKHVTQGGEDVATAFTPPGTGGYQPKAYFPKDLSGLAEAKKLLAEAGYGPKKPFPKVDILYNTGEIHKKVAEAIQQMWRKNLGVDVTLSNQEWKVYLDTMAKKNFQVIRARWGADYDDPNTFMELHVSNNGLNNTGYSNPKVDKLIWQTQKMKDGPERMKLFAEAEDIVMDEMPLIPLFIEKKNYLMKTKVEGVYSNNLSFYFLKDMSIK